MKLEWRSFLIDAGAEFTDSHIVSFGNPERERSITTTGDIMCDLSHCRLIGAYGEDALGFLQRQFSSDVTEVSSTHCQLSGYCNPNGRLLACFRVFQRGGSTFYLRLPGEILEATLTRLRMFVLRAKVTLEDASDATVRFGYSGRRAERELAEALGAYPTSVNDCVQTDDITILRIPGIQPRFELHGQVAAMTQLWTHLNVRATPVGASSWALLDILAGIPNILPPTRNCFLPQMVNLELLGGVSFRKGCYPGQEVIARMHYLGSLKRRMYRIHIATDTLPQPGDEIFSEEGDATEASGVIVDAQLHPDGGVEALGVLRIKPDRISALRLNGNTKRAEVRSLPYECTLMTRQY